MFSQCLCGFSLGAPASHSPKAFLLTGYSKLAAGVNVDVNCC